jgi:Na+/proline symporter
VTALDTAILLAFVVHAVASGLRARRAASRDLESYFLAGRRLRGTAAGLSMAATQFAADTPLLVTGLVATAGVFSLWRLWIYAVAFLLLGFVLAASWRRSGVVTDAELAELRYAGAPATALRLVKALYLGTLFNCVVLAMVLTATREISEPFLRWNEWLPAAWFEPLRAGVEAAGLRFASASPGPLDAATRSANNVLSVLALGGVTGLYSATGGLRSVVRTDVVQLLVMLLGTALYAGFVLAAVGGLDGLHAALEARFGAGGGPGGRSARELLAFTPGEAGPIGAAMLIVIAVQWLAQINADGTGYLAQRTLACRSDADARRAALVFVGVQILVRSLLWLPIALGLLVLFPPDPGLAGDALRAERESTYVRGFQTLLPPGALGLLLTAMLAALASTVDTHLNWGASYWANDLYGRGWCRLVRRREPSPRSLVWAARVSTLGILGAALAIMTQLGSIQQAWTASLLLGAGLGGVLVLRWLWWRINAWSELVALAASAALAVAALFAFPPEAEALRLLTVAGGATAVAVAVALATRPEPPERLLAFYTQVRPLGFWGPVARAAGERPGEGARRLARGLAAVALGAGSFFCLLTGLGSWMLGSPAPAIVPDRGLWIALLLALGAGLLPVAWRLGVREAA